MQQRVPCAGRELSVANTIFWTKNKPPLGKVRRQYAFFSSKAWLAGIAFFSKLVHVIPGFSWIL